MKSMPCKWRRAGGREQPARLIPRLHNVQECSSDGTLSLVLLRLLWRRTQEWTDTTLYSLSLLTEQGDVQVNE